MSYHASKKEAWLAVQLGIGMALVIAFAGVAQAQQRVLWQADDPFVDPIVPEGTTVIGGGVTVNSVDGEAATGDSERELVGEVILNGTGRFTNANPGILALEPSDAGQEFSLTVDYFIPENTAFDALQDGSNPDFFYIQINFDDVNSGSAGFVGLAQANTGWNTITRTGTVPATATSAQPFMIWLDGGFNADLAEPNGDGETVAMYIDNISFTVGIEKNGDFDNDSDVDGNDFLVWQRRLNNPLPDNPVTETFPEDLAFWQANYGQELTPPAAGAISSVPEPSSFALCLLAGAAAALNTRRRVS